MLQLYFNVISYYVFYENILVKYKMALGPLVKQTSTISIKTTTKVNIRIENVIQLFYKIHRLCPRPLRVCALGWSLAYSCKLFFFIILVAAHLSHFLLIP